MITTRTPVKWEGTYPDIAIKQGWNSIEKKFWIQVTDRRKGITIRGYMDEEYYHNFHNMGTYIFKQHSEQDPDTEFEMQEEPERNES